ncbi:MULTISPECIES: replication initiation factor domain-containing protein [unclassified Granulicatella]|uniref:replication initiation factor domain-containing protein n=1 Tax=unclassified Granulicatella TaxID=2630493 RepID=UPI0014307FB5|nr:MULTISPECIES: replication initiation factor domain-containing protein [unclassified Granulicatella]MBF0780672.1 replication initiation factor domain-containing protein [Granulicatella sp. 19428wC4_WM01]
MLSEFRREYGLSLSQLAKELGVTRQYVHHIETGHRQMTDDILNRLTLLQKQYQQRYELDVMIDWLHIQFNITDVKYIIQNVLHMNPEFFKKSETNRYNYGFKYELDKLIILQCKEERIDMGCLLSLSGQGCRLLERYLVERDVTWFEFLRHALNKGGKVTRIDLALDDYAEYFKLSEVIDKIERREFSTRFRRIEPKYSLEYQEDCEMFEKVGVTVYFGSRSSQLRVCMYQKNYELARKFRQPVSDFRIKNRYELRFMDDMAQGIVLQLLKQHDLSEVTLGVLFSRLQFFEKDKHTMWKPWEKLMNGVKKIELKIEPSATSYDRQLRYFQNSYVRSLKTLLEVDKANRWTIVRDTLLGNTLTKKYEDIIAVMTQDVLACEEDEDDMRCV